MVMIIGAGLLGLHIEKSATVHNCSRWCYTLWMWRKVSYVTISRDQGWFFAGAGWFGVEIFRMERAL